MQDMSKYDPDKELDDLHRALEAGNKAQETKSNHIQVEDLSNIADKYLSASARYDMNTKAYQLIAHDIDGRVYEAMYLATRVISGDEERAVQYLARVLNDLSRRGLIYRTLAPVSSIDLAMSSSVKTSAVFCFVLIPKESHDQVRSMYPEFVMQEGDIGRELYNLSPILSPGEFLTTISIHCSPLNPPQDVRSRFQEELEQYIAILPKGTRVRRITQLAITDLSVRFEVKFYNELLQDVKRVEMEYKRAVARVGDSLKQFNVVVGITYVAADGTFLYK